MGREAVRLGGGGGGNEGEGLSVFTGFYRTGGSMKSDRYPWLRMTCINFGQKVKSLKRSPLAMLKNS